MALITYLTHIEFDAGADAKAAPPGGRPGDQAPACRHGSRPGRQRQVESVAALFESRPMIFDGTPANPTEDAVMQALALYQQAGCDGIVGFGGGSSIDLAKAVRLLTGHAAPLAQYTAVEGGAARIHAASPADRGPTTSGTGSEVGRASVIITAEGRKLGIISPFMLPSIAPLRSRADLGLPPYLTAATGMDAISHCLETYMAPAINPPAEAIALDGLKRGFGAIRTRRRQRPGPRHAGR